MGMLFTAIADFLSENEEMIASLLVMAVDVILNEVVPAVISFLEIVHDTLPLLMDLQRNIMNRAVPAFQELWLGLQDLFNAFMEFAKTDEFKTLLASIVFLARMQIEVMLDLVEAFGLVLQAITPELVGVLRILAVALCRYHCGWPVARRNIASRQGLHVGL